jgi:hypothetical protein
MADRDGPAFVVEDPDPETVSRASARNEALERHASALMMIESFR